MRRILPLLCALGFCLANDSIAQNEIDYINSFYWSGYGKMAIDHDTLYLNSLNGAGVERYDIADPANPTFIDRTNVSGFDQIDFERRLMVDLRGNEIILSDFGDIENTHIVSQITFPQQENIYNWPSWQLKGNYLLLALEDDSLRVYDISDPGNPTLSLIIGFYRSSEYQYYGHYVLFGSTVCIDVLVFDIYDGAYRDIYDITDPNNVELADTTIDWGRMSNARGDTFCTFYSTGMFSWGIGFESFAPGDTSTLPYWEGGYPYWPPLDIVGGLNGFMIGWYLDIGGSIYTYDNFTRLGGLLPPPSYSFALTDDYYAIFVKPESLLFYQPTYDTTIMPQVAVVRPAHFGILSCAAYGNYIISGAESNGGELLVHELGQDGQLNLVATVPGIAAKKLIIAGTDVFCLSDDKIDVVNMSNPAAPALRHELIVGADLSEFEKYDSLIILLNTGKSIYSYSALNGFTLLYIEYCNYLDCPFIAAFEGRTLFEVTAETPYCINKYNLADPAHPQLVHLEEPVSIAPSFLEIINGKLWASGEQGTIIFDTTGTMDSLAFFGPEYFSDVHQARVSGETLYVSDGKNGLKVFTFEIDLVSGLTFVGGYGTGNDVNQIATIDDNFFISDYYSLQHLRWGAPTGLPPENEIRLPSEIALLQNYPNPFNARTVIEFSLGRQSNIELELFDILGRKVGTLADGVRDAGRHKVVWGAEGLSSGIYFYRLVADDRSEIKRCIILK